jgi:hypothetical protein
MKRFLLIVLCVLTSVAFYGGPVTKEQALDQAVAFVSARKNITSAKGMMKMAYKAPKLMSADSLQAYYYVFNVGQNGGFVIVSGDDRTEQILGYTDSGSYDATKIPDNMRWWLQEYAEQIKHLDDSTATVAATTRNSVIRKAPVATKTSISPLLTTTWNQATPYWNLCPVGVIKNTSTNTSTEQTCYTGCVATAMAQIMYYHKWPQTVMKAAVPSYTTNSGYSNVTYKSSGQTSLIMPELPAITLDWSNMLTSYSGSEPTTNTNAVAQLMLYCGCSVNMSYGPTGSGASTYYVPSALINYFGYDADAKYVSRDGYSIADWDALIYNEIKNSRPVLYSGASMSVGHAFVCDGYDEDNFYHINWGWGGMQNGYFRLSVLNPSSTGIGGGSSEDGYSMGQGAVIGIQPDDGATTAETVRLTTSSCYLTNGTNDTQTVTRTSSDNDFSVAVKFNGINNLNNTYTFSYGLGLYKDGSLLSPALIGTYSRPVGTGYTLGLTYSFGAGLADGTYLIKPISKESTSSTWLEDIGADRYYIKAVISGNSMTLTNVKPIVSLTVNSLEFTGSKVAGSSQELKMTITNNGAEYNGNLFVYANGTVVAENGVALEAGKTSVVYFHYTPSAAGTYTMTVKAGGSESTATDLGFSSSQVITAASTSAASFTFTPSIKNANGSKIYGNQFILSLNVKNTGTSDYNNYIRAWLFKWSNGSGSSSNYITKQTSIAANASENMNFEFDNLDYGAQYSIRIEYVSSNARTNWDGIVYNLYTMTRAIISWDKSGTATYSDGSSASYTVPSSAVAVDLQGTSVTGVTLSSGVSPNCLYFLDSGDATPAGLSGKNVVKGGTADAITLADENDFYSPYAFTANTINYSRTFTKGADGTGANWSTVAFPFKPTKVMNTTDNVVLDWFHSSSEVGKMLWIDDFTQEDAEANKVYFDYVGTELQANHPYIIAVAGSKWGSKWDLTNKVITFSAANADVLATPKALVEGVNYNFIGGTVSASKAASTVYYLNDAGNNFALNAAEKTVEPFRAYFILRTSPYDVTTQAKSLNICFVGDDETTGLAQPTVVAESDVDVYNLNGMKIRSGVSRDAALQGLPKGIYIVNGKKVVK